MGNRVMEHDRLLCCMPLPIVLHLQHCISLAFGTRNRTTFMWAWRMPQHAAQMVCVWPVCVRFNRMRVALNWKKKLKGKEMKKSTETERKLTEHATSSNHSIKYEYYRYASNALIGWHLPFPNQLKMIFCPTKYGIIVTNNAFSVIGRGLNIPTLRKLMNETY